MGVFHTHAIAGSLGGILVGFFAEPILNNLFYTSPHVGILYGLKDNKGLKQFGLQIGGMLFIIVLNVILTSLICLLIRLIVPLRMSEEELQIGDDAVHGEEAYAIWSDGEKLEISRHNSNYDLEEYPAATKKASK